MFNPWRPYKWFKPKKSGWYQCTVKTSWGDELRTVMDLYFDTACDERWIDSRRLNVFLGYKVYAPSRAAIEDNRVYEDVACDRTLGVIAWRKLPKPFGYKKKQEKDK